MGHPCPKYSLKFLFSKLLQMSQDLDLWGNVAPFINSRKPLS